MTFSRSELIDLLTTTDPAAIEDLWQRADRTRRDHVGDAVHLRGLIEISNHCSRTCAYCGLRAPNTRTTRYRMTHQQILEAADLAGELGYGTVVLQSGEDPMHTGPWVRDLVAAIKSRTPLAVTLSLGERPRDDLAMWRDAGADRYLLRFETSNRQLFQRIHLPKPSQPPTPESGCVSVRIDMLAELRDLGYEVGSGVMVGLPGQTYEDLADDLLTFARLELDMVGLGPFIPHPDTPLAQQNPHTPLPQHDPRHAHPDRPRPDVLTTCKMIALTRLMLPDSNIPSTSALATIDTEHGRELALQRGGNVIMPNVTPTHFRTQYQIYPGKACIREEARTCHACLAIRIHALGRTIGVGPGHSPGYVKRMTQTSETTGHAGAADPPRCASA